MGATGSMLESGGFREQNWETIDYIDGIKVISPKANNNNTGLPSISNTPNTTYILLDKDGNFKQLKKYDSNRKMKFDIDYGLHNNELTFHMHTYTNGIKNPGAVSVPQDYIEKYIKTFKGVPKKWLKK